MKWEIKRFKELSADELYQILQLRSEVFVVEQNCVYQDIDGKDRKSLHLFALDNGMITAYARLFDRGHYFEEASIGRVVTHQKFRGRKVGHDLMKRAIEAISDYFNQTIIEISAQEYLQKFYESHGFVKVGESYLEDGIPHIKMIRS